MKTLRRQRLLQLVMLLAAGGVFGALVLLALIQDTGAFVSPSSLLEAPRQPGARLSVGGWVVADSWERSGLDQEFVLADEGAQIRVFYSGILPDLFAEEEAAVATGTLLADGSLAADEVLAKHDENYRPPGVIPPQKSGYGETSGAAD